MNSEVRIRLVGDDIPTFIPIGATIHYGIGKIPCAFVELDPNSLSLLCDFDSIRRKPVDLYVDTTAGCLHFSGLIDGLSFHQSPGMLNATMVIKSPFQWLTEIYPRIIGIHPSSINAFRPQPMLTWNNTHPDEVQILGGQIANSNLKLDTSLNLVDFIINVMKLAIQSQVLQQQVPTTGTTPGLLAMMKDADLNRKNLTPLVMELLNGIDTSACQGLEILGSTQGVCSMTFQNIAMMRDNIWANLTRMLADIGCTLIVGNEKAYVVPEASFLRVPKLQTTQRRKRSFLPNTVFPAEYDNLSFNDNGFINLKGVYVTHDQGVRPFNLGTTGAVEMGYYIDELATGNILVTSLPAFISFGIVESAVFGGQGLHSRIKKRASLCGIKVPLTTAKTSMVKTSALCERSFSKTKQYMDQWAQMEYCRLKYDDRTGNINTAFNNNWAPGAVGSAYTRLPGTYMDFYVTDVTHIFQLTAPNGGRANTNINFKAGRMGPAANAGLDSIDLYDYDYSSAQEFSTNFINNIAN
jgi:hypothetical protein